MDGPVLDHVVVVQDEHNPLLAASNPVDEQHQELPCRRLGRLEAGEDGPVQLGQELGQGLQKIGPEDRWIVIVGVQ